MYGIVLICVLVPSFELQKQSFLAHARSNHIYFLVRIFSIHDDTFDSEVHVDVKEEETVKSKEGIKQLALVSRIFTCVRDCLR